MKSQEIDKSSPKEVSHTGIVTRVINHKKSSAIFKMDVITKDRISPIKVRAAFGTMPIRPGIGEVWHVTGIYESHPKHGTQLEAATCEQHLPTGSILIQFIGENPKFAGIGAIKAKRLWAEFGEDLYRILNEADLVELTDKKKVGLSHALAASLCETWETYAAETPVVQWLHSHGFPTRLARHVLNFWGGQALRKISTDPYRMLAFERWDKVDKLALSLGVARDSHRRKAAAIEDTAYDRYDKGSTAVTERELRQGFVKKTGLHINSISDAGPRAMERLVAINGLGLFQSIGAYALESLIKERLLCCKGVSTTQDSLFKPKFDSNTLRDFEARSNIHLNDEQVMAIKSCLECYVSCITGGAGVGKTTVLKAIFDQIENEVIYQVALTGRAVKRMMEATGHEARTIASFIYQARDNQIQENCFVFIDEASMVDIPMLYRLLKVIPESARICFVGDPYQLPPIGPGLPFKTLVSKPPSDIPVVHLKETHRFDKGSGILEVADSVRRQSAKIVLAEYSGALSDGAGVSFIDAVSTRDLIDSALRVYRELSHHGEVQLIAPTNKICSQINGHLHNENVEVRRYKGLPTTPVPIVGSAMTIGDPLLYRDRNDYDKELYNGSLGVLTEIYDHPVIGLDENDVEQTYIAQADFDQGNIVDLSEDDFEHISLGYCITVHKSQGSQFERVVFLCPESSRKGNLDNSLIYTAITRARRQVCVIGGRQTFLRECSSPPRAFERSVGLSFEDGEK